MAASASENDEDNNLRRIFDIFNESDSESGPESEFEGFVPEDFANFVAELDMVQAENDRELPVDVQNG